MRNFNTKAIAAALFATVAVSTASAQIPQGYYDSLKGKKGAELKTAVHNIVKEAKVLEYGSGEGKTWYGFWTTDRTDDGKYIDRYSPESSWVMSTAQGESGAGMNIEHSFPKSWWGKAQNQAYKDLYNLMPCESKINSTKSNYPMGEVVSGDKGNGFTKVGKGPDGNMYWEPADKWKGEFARGYMYMATTYQNLTWTGAQALQILQQGDYPTLQEWAYKLYIQWAKEDPVDALEVKRNNDVSKIQGNRNPFVDFPNLMEYIWGDSIDYAFDPANTLTTEKYVDGGDPTNPDNPQPGDEWETFYSVNYKGDNGGCSIEIAQAPTEGGKLWTNTAQYGWKASGFVGGKNNVSDGSSVTPVIDLAESESATFSFNHAEKFDTNPAERMSVEVRCEGTTTKLGGINWPSGNNWTFVSSGDVDLTPFAGKKIQIAFHYTSTADVAGTWEIGDIAVKGKKKGSTGIGCIFNPTASSFNPSAPYTVYDLSGHRINNINEANGVVVVKQNGKTFKMMRN